MNKIKYCPAFWFTNAMTLKTGALNTTFVNLFSFDSLYNIVSIEYY